MNEKIRLPIKIVPPLKRDFYKPNFLMKVEKKVFVEVTQELRENFVSQILDLRKQFEYSFKEYPDVPAVALVNLKNVAIAKSHRPNNLFSTQTCPIIGMEGLGELLLSVTAKGIDKLAQKIEKSNAKSITANISTLEKINPYKPKLISIEKIDTPLKVKLFKHRFLERDNAINKAFYEIFEKKLQPNVTEVFYDKGLKIFKLENTEKNVLKKLYKFVGIQSVQPFPFYSPVKTSSTIIRDLEPEDFPFPQPDMEYPLIGVIDSGTFSNDSNLSPWIFAREEYVPPDLQDNSHGTFVSGLLVHPRLLNHKDERFPSCSSKIVDVVAIGKDKVSEDQLLTILEDVIPKYPKVKIWNLSLSTKQKIRNQNFSDFAVALDRLQDQYGVTFVLAAGNLTTLPLRESLPHNLGERDRICAPADSVRSIVVASIAHRDHSSSNVKNGEPSPFSLRGPGPLYLPKPELVHIGGNCNSKGDCSQIGVLSLNGKGQIAENIGTSFAAPLISTLTANLSSKIKGKVSRLLTRALLVHASAMEMGKIDEELLPYVGFGVPPDIDVILSCSPWQCTLIFELSIPPNIEYEKAVFPLPECLYAQENKVCANILMTLAYDSELDASFGTEYCRTNVDVSLGTFDIGKDGKNHQSKQVPEDAKLKSNRYEKGLVEHGFKWSPIKVYRRDMVKGVKGDVWRLDLSVHHRSGYLPTKPQNVVLIITIADPKKSSPVYNQMITSMNKLGWATMDLEVQSRIRV